MSRLMSFSDKSRPELAEEQQNVVDTAFKADSRTETDDLEDHTNPLGLVQIAIIPEVRKCGIVDFKNRFNAAEKGIYAVDVLESDTTCLEHEIQEELKLRRFLPKTQTKNRRKAVELTPKLATRDVRVAKSSTKLVTRIRIQSPALLFIISKCMNESWESRPRTFLRPFRPLISFHPQVCDALKDLELRWGQQGDMSETGRTPASLDGTGDQDVDEEIMSLDDSAAALTELKSYVEFMSREIMPLYHRFETLDETSNAKIRFSDLWCLYRPAEILFRNIGIGADRDLGNLALGNRYWRTYGVSPGLPKYSTATPDHRNYIGDTEIASFRVHCYYIDYTGDEFCAVTETFEIQPYEGERPIKSLNVFPQRFLANHEAKWNVAIELSKMFLRTIETRHASYNWWTMTLDPRGEPTTDAEGNILKRPEYVDSEVIVDFVEAFQACPSWKPVPSNLKPEEPTQSTTFDEFSICWWSDSERTKLLAETSEIIVLRAGITTWERNKNLEEDKFLTTIRENDRNSTLTTAEYLRECDLVFLPQRQFAYVLRDRKFVQVASSRLKPVEALSDAFDCLKIDDSHKGMIQSLVEDHFMRKATDKKDGVERLDLDWIKGKGKGLFILLHGVPGVGKTATAEAVAQASGKPLFTITCGDLGLTPMEVETALQRIFRLANTWDCVLLLDEVDTFFSQRAKGDATVGKNALVSVFLRVLEYYDGLLFLTTNRAGALDEAFRSRIHLTLYYPPLSYQQTMDIWKLNIDRLRKVEKERCENLGKEPLQINEQELLRFAKEKFNQERGKSGWNGRQIRNAFQIGSSLAHFDARRDGTTPRLSVEHFKMIHRVTQDFDKYMQETKGKSDGGLAFDRGDRADHWEATEGRIEGAHSYEPQLGGSGSRFAGGMSLGKWMKSNDFPQQRPVSPFSSDVNNNSYSLQPTSPRLFQSRPQLGRNPSITINQGPQASLRDGERSPRTGSNEYNGQGYDHFSPDGANGHEISGGWKRGREMSDPDTQGWFKRRKEFDQEAHDQISP